MYRRSFSNCRAWDVGGGEGSFELDATGYDRRFGTPDSFECSMGANCLDHNSHGDERVDEQMEVKREVRGTLGEQAGTIRRS